MHRFRFILFSLCIATSLMAQEDILEKYVQQGLINNLALKQKQFSFEQSMAALKQARGLFLPTVNIEARYSRSGGGRVIDIPIGDLMNPVYGSLNQLIGLPVFPTDLPNERIPFLREKEHDTKIRVIQPLFQAPIYYNYKIQSNLKQIESAAVEIFKQQLTEDIQTAYFNYLKAYHVVDLFQKTLSLVNENLRVSEKLFQNGQATEDIVFRARAERSAVEQNLLDAGKNKKIAAAYFNFLLNQPLETPIVIIDDAWQPRESQFTLEEAQTKALANRLEFRQLGSAIGAADNTVKLNTGSFLPGISGVFDYGFQGEAYKFTEKDDYWMASLVLQWNLFHGFQDKSKITSARLERNKLTAQLDELTNQIKLQVQEAFDNLTVARQAIVSANERLASARNSFRIVTRKYEQGMAPQIEYLDARTTYTNAEVNYIISKFDYFIKCAQFERVVSR